MTDEELEIFREITNFSGKPNDLHPLKLDKWWKTLVGAPDPIYLQMGFHAIFQQIDKGAMAVQAMLDLVGPGNLPVTHQEISQRHIGLFNFHVPSETAGTWAFSVSWDKIAGLWVLASGHADAIKMMIPDLDKAIAKAIELGAELDSEAGSEE